MAMKMPTNVVTKFMYTICQSAPNLSGSCTSAASFWRDARLGDALLSQPLAISLRQPKMTRNSAASRIKHRAGVDDVVGDLFERAPPATRPA